MQETKVLGALLPSHPDLQPIIQELRDKYQLPEISPGDDPIEEIFLDDKQIPLADFRQEIIDLVQEKVDFFDPKSKFRDLYKQGKLYLGEPRKVSAFEKFLPKEIKKLLNVLHEFLQSLFKFMVPLVDKQNENIADIIYIYLLTGETQEAPADWLSKVGVMNIDEEPLVFLMASQFVDPEIMVQQFREQYVKTFGRHKPKVTNTVISTAYFLRLRKLKKPWQFIVEEFIRLNKFSLPRDRSSKRYFETRQKYERMLRKRINRSEKVLDVLARDIETKTQ